VSFEVGVVAHFTARHRLFGDFGPASEPHEHAYTVEAAVRGDELRNDGTLVDIVLLQDALRMTTNDLDGRDLNEVAGLSDANTTAEVVARFVFDRIVTALRGKGLRSLQMRVWESPEAYASYTGDVA
jgi:6-pyruvoyltetrahydropterin/6-carboxytetrahydropterin synthase